MPDSKCDESFAPNNNEVVTSTGPLHVITQYAGTDISNIMQSPSRPTSLGLCLSNNHPEFKSSLSFRGGVSQEGCYQSWTARGVDTAEFEKLLGNLGNNGSTPVTPTSFLNPNNITEDQEQFADNFSRTLNKVKAEQEGWSTISNSSSLDGDLRGAANPTFAKQIQINRIASMPFIENYTTGTDNSNTIESENGQIKSPLHISDSTEVNSPRLTDRPLVLLPNTSNTTHTTHSGVNSLRKHSTNSKCSSSTSDPFQENFYPNILSTSNLNHSNKTSADVPWVSGLPTISSIADGLKQAVVDRDCISSNFCSNLDALSSNSRFDNLTYSHDDIRCHGLSGNVLTSTENILCDENSGEIHSRLSQKLPVLTPCSPDMQAADILVHYAVRENHSGVHLNGSCSESLVDSLVASSSSSRLCTNDSSNLGIRKALNELYSSVCPTLSGGGGCRILTPVLSSVPESLTSSDNACCENGQKNPVRLYVGHQSNTSMDCSNHLLDNHLNPNSIASQSPRSSVTHNGDSMLNRNDVLLSHSSDSHSNGISDNGDTLSQQFDGMYCALGNHFSLPLSEADKPRRSSLLIQPCTGFATTSQLVSCTNPVCDTFLDAHMLQSLRSPGVPSTNVKQVTTNSIYNLTSIPSFLCNENSDEHDPGNTYFRQLSSSKSETIDMTSFPAVTSCLNAFPVEPLSLVTHSNYLKKPKRQGVVNKKSRTNTSNRSSCLPSVCDSSTDRIPVQDTFSESSKGHAKRSRNLTGRGSLTFPGRISRSGCNNEDYPLVNEQSYFADSAKRLLIKSESLMADDIDDASDHSESLSAGTGCAVRNNTPASSLDEVEQHHLKLERKRARNRVAARRCRERKLSLIRSLENQVAERDAQVRSLEDTLARYRAEGERLRLHIEMLARSYPNLKAELYRFPFLFQLPSSQQHTQSQQPSSNQTTPIKDELPDTSSSHFT